MYIRIICLLVLLGSTGAMAQVPKYIAVIDAGSGGSRVFVYRVKQVEGKAPQVVFTSWNKSIRPGLSSLAAYPAHVGAYLAPLINFVKSKVKKDSSRTDFRLAATAGLRLLPQTQYESLMAATEKYLKTTGFHDPEAEIISGQAEGLYAWIAANQLMATKERRVPDAKTSLGIVALGGASLQITFIPNPLSPRGRGQGEGDLSHHVKWLDWSHHPVEVYSYSYNGLGLAEASRKWRVAACDLGQPFDGCKNSISQHIVTVAQPQANGQFLGIGKIFQIADTFGLASLSMKDANGIDATGRAVCLSNLNQLQKRYPKAEESALKNGCFSLAYLSSVLSKLGFGKANPNIEATKYIDKQKITWTYGIAVDEVLNGDKSVWAQEWSTVPWR